MTIRSIRAITFLKNLYVSLEWLGPELCDKIKP